MATGSHTFKYKVLTAAFYGQSGEIVDCTLHLYAELEPDLICQRYFYVVFLVYPNPTSDYAMIKGGKKLSRVTVLSMEGRKLSETDHSKIDLTPYPAGTYLLNIQLEGGIQFTHKVIKK